MIGLLLLFLLPIASSLRICDIQGDRWLSPYKGQQVHDLKGIVSATDGSRGFYLQDHPNPRRSPTKSSGIFVYTKDSPLKVGDSVNIGSATVAEYKSNLKPDGNAVTQLTKLIDVTVIAEGVAVESFDVSDAPTETVYFNDPFTITETTVNIEEKNAMLNLTRGLDYFESLEGMLVTIVDPVAVSIKNRYGGFWVVAHRGRYATGMNARGGITVTSSELGFVDVNPEKFLISSPFDKSAIPSTVRVGDEVATITGIVEWGFGNWRVRPVSPVKIQSSRSDALDQSDMYGTNCELTIVTYNVENMHPKKSTMKHVAKQIVENLNSPDIIALQEIQDDSGAKNNGVVSCDIGLDNLIALIAAEVYQALNIDPINNADGGIPGGNIRPVMLYRPDRVRLAPTVLDRPGEPLEAQEVVRTATGPMLKYNPGRIDPTNPAWIESRKPLTAVFEFKGEQVFVINNHLKSKMHSTVLFGNTQPFVNGGVHQRILQTTHLNQFVSELVAADPNVKVIVLGDFNDLSMTPPLTLIEQKGDLVELMDSVLLSEERYTYNYDGNCQAIDHIYVTKNLAVRAAVQAVHVNTWFPDKQKGSDHDPLAARLSFCNKKRVATTEAKVTTKKPTKENSKDQAKGRERTSRFKGSYFKV